MPDFRIVEITPTTLDAPTMDAAAAIARANYADAAEGYGHADFAPSAELLTHRLRHPVDCERPFFVALAGADVLGVANAELSLVDNPQLLDDCHVHVRADARRRGVGRALVDALVRRARARDRTHLLGFWPARLGDPADAGALRSRTDPLVGLASGASAFARSLGFEVAQIERYSVFEVDRGGAAPAASGVAGYRLLSWQGRTPPAHRAGVAALLAAFSTDAPTGDVAWGDEAWDADRLAEHEAVDEAVLDRATTIAVHEASGAVAAMTGLVQERDSPASAEQGVTVVDAGHRGHGLGLAIKRANLAAAGSYWPGLARVHTWNAGENEHMWRINAALGFTTRGVEVCWQRVLPPLRA